MSDQPQDLGAALEELLDVMEGPYGWRADLEALIQKYAQKYAEKVIGEDEVIESMDADWALIETSRQMNGAKPYHFKQARNLHREYQRQRNQEMKGEI